MRIADEPLLDRFRQAGRCEWCHTFCKRRDPHHVFARGFGGGLRIDVALNLVSLCPHDHIMHHNGHHPFRANLLEIVAKREGLSVLEIVDEINRIRRLPKGSDYAPRATSASDRQSQPDAQDQRHRVPADIPLAGPEGGEPGVETF